MKRCYLHQPFLLFVIGEAIFSEKLRRCPRLEVEWVIKSDRNTIAIEIIYYLCNRVCFRSLFTTFAIAYASLANGSWTQWPGWEVFRSINFIY